MTWKQISAAMILAATLGAGALVKAQQPQTQGAGSKQDQIAALKQSIQQGMTLARKYEAV